MGFGVFLTKSMCNPPIPLAHQKAGAHSGVDPHRVHIRLAGKTVGATNLGVIHAKRLTGVELHFENILIVKVADEADRLELRVPRGLGSA